MLFKIARRFHSTQSRIVQHQRATLRAAQPSARLNQLVEYEAAHQEGSSDVNIYGGDRLQSGIAPYTEITADVQERFAALTPEHGS